MITRYLLQWSLTIASGLAAIVLGFFIVPPFAGISFVKYGGYFIILTAVFAFALALWREGRTRGFDWSPADWRITGLAVVAATIWQMHEPHAFKVLMDEMVLGATSMSMHFDREVFTPLKTHEIDGLYLVMGGLLDKRPLFFPFLVSVVHDLTGYRPENAFVVNGIVSVVLLVLTGRLGRVLGGSDRAGYLAVLLLAGFPLVGLSATGGGFDLLNLAMICAVGLLAVRYIRDGCAETQDAYVLGAVLLAQTRYESAIFLGMVAAALAVTWWRKRRPVFSWSLPLAPILLLTIPFQNKLFAITPGYWNTELSGPPFDPRYFSTNLGHAVNFLFAWDGFQAGSPLVSVVGGIGLLFALVFMLRRWRQTMQEPEQLAFALTAGAILANFALVLCYFWGQLDDFVAARLGMPLVLLFVLSSAFILGRWLSSSTAWISVFAVATAWFWIWAIPFSAKAQGTSSFLPFQETTWERSFTTTRPGRVFFVMRSSLPAIIERKPAMSVEMLSERASEMAFQLAAGTYDEVLVFQRLQLNPVTRKYLPDAESRLGPEFVLEVVAERQHRPNFRERMSRLVAVDLTKAGPASDKTRTKFPPFRMAAGGGEDPTAAYMREFLQNLP